MKQGDIYFANLNPSKGSEQRGTRPVVIISGNSMNDNLSIVIVCPLSSKIKKYSGCVVVKKDSINKLSVDSEIITFQIRVLSKERLTKKLGRITNNHIKEVIHGLNEILIY